MFLLTRVEESLTSGKGNHIVDPDLQKNYTKRKQVQSIANEDSGSDKNIRPNSPSDGWATHLRTMPFFSRAEMNLHIAKSGKNIDPHKKTYVPRSVRKTTTFLNG